MSNRQGEFGERIRAVMDSLVDPVVLLEAVRDDDGRIVDFTYLDANAAALVINRTAYDDLIGTRLLSLFPHHLEGGLLDVYGRVVDTGETAVLNDQEYRHEDTPGEPRYYDIRVAKVFDGITLTWREVTDRHEAAKALAESERRFRMLAENASDVVLEITADGTVAWCSPSVTTSLGWRVDEVVGGPLSDLAPPDERDSWDFWRSASSGVVSVNARQDSPRWMAFHVVQRRDADGAVEGSVVGLSDITDVLRAERDALVARQGQERTRMSLEEAAIGIVLVDADGTVTYANPAIHRIMGAPEGEIVGQPALGGAVDREDREAAERLLSDVLGERCEGGARRRHLFHGSGSTVWVDTFVSPLRNAGGDVDGALVQVIDVTAEVANREALARSVEHFRLLAENASDVVYETDAQGCIVWVSPSVRRALGWEPESLLGTPAIDLVDPDDRARAGEARVEVQRGGERLDDITRFRTVDGRTRTMSMVARPLQVDQGQATGAVVGLRDVTGEMRARARLERSERTFRIAMLGAPQGVALADAHDCLTDVNDAMTHLLRRDRTELLGRRLTDFVVTADPEDLTCAEHLLASGESRVVSHEHCLLPDPGSGDQRWVSHAASLVRDEDGAPMFFIHHLLDVTDRHHREEFLSHRATHDALTGLLNRDGLMSRLDDWVPDHGHGGLAVLYCDLDGLKDINDGHGHAAGDAVLSTMAARLQEEVRRGDLVSRLGGDEFVIVLDRVQSLEDAAAIATKIADGAAGPVPFDGESLPGSLSVGVALVEEADTPEGVLERADAALYRAKSGARGRVAT